MDNSPKPPKYNPMEIDDDVYPIRGINMIEESKKDCKLCQYAPVITLVILDFFGSFNGLAKNVYWYLFEMMFAVLYLRHITSVNDIFTRKPNGSIQYKPYGLLIGIMFGITIRTLFILFSSIGYVPLG